LIKDDPCFLLDHLGDELRKRRTTARDLLAIKFRSEDDHVIVVTRQQPLSERYPQLSEILDDIGRTGRDEGIGVEQLRRISFFEGEVNLETEDTSGSRTFHLADHAQDSRLLTRQDDSPACRPL
jgi:hypothetical protein